MKRVIILLLLVFSIGFSVAFDYSQVDGVEVPSQLRGIIGNQEVNVFLDDNFLFSMSIVDGLISYSEQELSKSSLGIYISSSAMEKIQGSEDKAGEIISSYKSGEIRIVRKTLMNKIKFWFVRFFI